MPTLRVWIAMVDIGQDEIFLDKILGSLVLHVIPGGTVIRFFSKPGKRYDSITEPEQNYPEKPVCTSFGTGGNLRGMHRGVVSIPVGLKIISCKLVMLVWQKTTLSLQ